MHRQLIATLIGSMTGATLRIDALLVRASRRSESPSKEIWVAASRDYWEIQAEVEPDSNPSLKIRPGSQYTRT